VRRNAQVPQCLGLGRLVADLGRQPAGLLQERNRGLVVTPDELMETADPEQRLGLAAHIAQRPVKLYRTLEQWQFSGVFAGR